MYGPVPFLHTILRRPWDPNDPLRSYRRYSTSPDTASSSQDRDSKSDTRILAKADKSQFHPLPHVLESERWRGARVILGEALSRSTRRRIRRPGASLRLTRPCVRGGGRAVVQRDLSEIFGTSLSHSTGVGHAFTYEIGIVGVCAKSDIGIRCIALRHVGGELPELSI